MTIEITKQQVAQILDCDVRTVTTYQNQQIDPLPMLSKGKRGTQNIYDAVAIHRWDLRRQSQKESKEDEANELLPLDFEKWRKTKADADAQEMKNLITKREQAPVVLLEFAISNFSEQAKSLFESIPLKVKKKLPHLRASEIEMVKREIVKIQNAATKIRIDWTKLEDIH